MADRGKTRVRQLAPWALQPGRLLALLWGVWTLTAVAHADDAIAISVAEPPIQGLVQVDGQGAYQRLVQAALSGSRYRLASEHYPFKRALSQFLERQYDCVYSQTELAEAALGPEQIVASVSLSQFGFYLLVPAGQPAPSGVTDLRGRRVVGILGQIDYYAHLLQDLDILELPSEQQALEMLRLGRADVYIGAMPDLWPLRQQFSVDLSRPLVLLQDRLTCHRTPRNVAFVNFLSERLQALQASGERRRILGDHYFEPENWRSSN